MTQLAQHSAPSFDDTERTGAPHSRTLWRVAGGLALAHVVRAAVGVELLGPGEVREEQHGVVEPDRAHGRRHQAAAVAVGPTSFQPLCHAQPLPAFRLMFRNAISSSDRAIRRPPASIGR